MQSQQLREQKNSIENGRGMCVSVQNGEREKNGHKNRNQTKMYQLINSISSAFTLRQRIVEVKVYLVTKIMAIIIEFK